MFIHKIKMYNMEKHYVKNEFKCSIMPDHKLQKEKLITINFFFRSSEHSEEPMEEDCEDDK